MRFRPLDLSCSPTQAFRWMRWRICCSTPRPIVRPVESFFPNSGMCEDGHSHHCMADMWLLCTAGMLNGVFGEGENRHIAHWRSVKFTDHWEEEEEDGTKILHDRERFSHELTLVYSNGETQILTHEKKESE